MATAGALTKEVIKKMRNKFLADQKNILAQNACVKYDPTEVSVSREKCDQISHVFSHKIDPHGKPVTDQKTSGRCWIFAALNVMRIPFMKHYNLEEFQFSQTHLFFWDKLERANFFLHNIYDTALKGEPVDGRLVAFLLKDPLEDGGQWDMLVNLIKRHGLIPKTCFPESFCSENTSRLNTLCRSKLKEFALAIRNLITAGATKEKVEATIHEQMTMYYRILSIALGTPPETVTWEYYDKSKNYHKEETVTPQEFYEKFVKPHYNIDDKVCLVSDPRPNNPFGKLYTLEYLGNVLDGKMTLYNNQPSELLLKLCAESIKNNEPVWFGSDVWKRNNIKHGVLDLKFHDYEATFGTDFQLGMTKADRLLYGESCMVHAMVFTAVSLDKDDKITKLRVENSWGEDRGDKGYLLCTPEWFHEFVFEIVVDKKIVPADVLAVFEQTPIVLPAWDPMGTLAH